MSAYRRNRSLCSFEKLEARQFFSAGGLDGSFGSNGFETTPFGFTDPAAATAVQADGSILVVGQKDNEFAVGRLNPDGTIDTSFGNNGLVLTNFGGKLGSEAEAVTVQPDGRIVVAGEQVNQISFGVDQNARWCVARYNSDGSLDTTFGSRTGMETVAGLSNTYGIDALAVAPSGNIFFTATEIHYSFGVSHPYAATVELLPDGTLDSNWGDPASNGQREGLVQTNLGQGNDYPEGLAFTPDGKVVVGIQDGSASSDVVRYTANGVLDKTFNGSGVFKIADVPNALVQTVYVEPNGSILAGGTLETDTFLYEITPQGKRETSFGPNGLGYVLEHYSPKRVDTDVITSIFMPRPDRIVVIGIGDSPSGGNIIPDGDRVFAAGYNLKGAPDKSFGSGGVTIAASGGYVWGAGAAMTPQGGIVVAAQPQNDFDNDVPLKLLEFNTYQPTVQISGSDTLIVGDGETPMIVFTLDDAYNFATQIDYSVGGTAVAGKNYFSPLTPLLVTTHGITPLTNGVINFAPGQSVVEVPITVPPDPSQTGTLDIVISLTANDAYQLGGSTTATVTIRPKRSTGPARGTLQTTVFAG